MKPLRVDVALLVAHTGATHLIPEDRCKLFDAVPNAVMLGVAGWADEDAWRRLLGFSPDGWVEFGRAVYAPILEHAEGWGLRPLAEAAEAQKSVSAVRAKAGRRGGRRKQTKANAKQTEANAKQMLSLASSCCGDETSGGEVSGGEVTPASSIDSKDSKNLESTLFLLGGAGGKWVPTREQVEAWEAAYPSVSLSVEFAKMRGWLASNPTRAKTDRGLPRFVNSWLGRATPTPLSRVHEELGSVWGLTPKRGVARG